MPSNTTCATALDITTLPYSGTFDTTSCPTDPLSPDCGGGTSYSAVWFRVIIPTGVFSVNFDTGGSDYDTVMSAWTGVCGGLTQVACNDDTVGSTSYFKLTVTPGDVYYILVASFDPGGGNLTFGVTRVPSFGNQLVVIGDTTKLAVYNRNTGSVFNTNIEHSYFTGRMIRKDNYNIVVIVTGATIYEFDPYLVLVNSPVSVINEATLGFDRDSDGNMYSFDSANLYIRSSTYPFTLITSYVLPVSSPTDGASISKDSLTAYWPIGLGATSNVIKKYILGGALSDFASYGTNYNHPAGNGYYCAYTYTMTNGNVIGIFPHAIAGVVNTDRHIVIFDSNGNQLLDITGVMSSGQCYIDSLALTQDESAFLALDYFWNIAYLYRVSDGAILGSFPGDSSYNFPIYSNTSIIPFGTSALPFGGIYQINPNRTVDKIYVDGIGNTQEYVIPEPSATTGLIGDS